MDAEQATSLVITVPAWVDETAQSFGPLDDDTARMELAIRLAEMNALQGGGPFGAAVFLGERLLAAGVNLVLESGFTIAHAEVIALMRAQKILAADGSDETGRTTPYTLVTSTEPCCQCFGAVVWSDVTRLVCGAFTEDAEAIGFDEGPKPQNWQELLEQRSIQVTRGVLRAQARGVLDCYRARGGRLY